MSDESNKLMREAGFVLEALTRLTIRKFLEDLAEEPRLIEVVKEEVAKYEQRKLEKRETI